MLRIFLVLLLSLSIFSCADSGGDSKKPKPHRPDVIEREKPGPTPRPRAIPPAGQQNLPPDPPADSQIVRNQAQTLLTCREDCVESVGFIVGLSYDEENGTRELKPYVCTGSLIGENVVLTNSHCIPDDLKENPSKSCTDRISIRFPETNKFKSEAFYCAKIYYASEIDDTLADNEDYAIFTINHVPGRETYKIDRSGFNPAENFVFTKVNPVKDPHSIRGHMETWHDCLPVMGSIVVPTFADAMSSTISLFNCPVMGGNSGSPVFDNKGRVRGVIFGGVPIENIQRAGLREYGPVRTDVSMITSLACLDWSGFGRKHPDCRGVEGRVQRALRETDAEFQRQVGLADDDILKSITETEYQFSPIKPSLSNTYFQPRGNDRSGFDYSYTWNMGVRCIDPDQFRPGEPTWVGAFASKITVRHRVHLDEYWRRSIQSYDSYYRVEDHNQALARRSSSGGYQYQMGVRSWRGIRRCLNRPGHISRRPLTPVEAPDLTDLFSN